MREELMCIWEPCLHRPLVLDISLKLQISMLKTVRLQASLQCMLYAAGLHQHQLGPDSDKLDILANKAYILPSLQATISCCAIADKIKMPLAIAGAFVHTPLKLTEASMLLQYSA